MYGGMLKKDVHVQRTSTCAGGDGGVRRLVRMERKLYFARFPSPSPSPPKLRTCSTVVHSSRHIANISSASASIRQAEGSNPIPVVASLSSSSSSSSPILTLSSVYVWSAHYFCPISGSSIRAAPSWTVSEAAVAVTKHHNTTQLNVLKNMKISPPTMKNLYLAYDVTI